MISHISASAGGQLAGMRFHGPYSLTARGRRVPRRPVGATAHPRRNRNRAPAPWLRGRGAADTRARGIRRGSLETDRSGDAATHGYGPWTEMDRRHSFKLVKLFLFKKLK